MKFKQVQLPGFIILQFIMMHGQYNIKKGQTFLPETSARNCHYTPRNITEERRLQNELFFQFKQFL